MKREEFISYYKRNDSKGVDGLMKHLTSRITLVDTKRIDFYLGLMDSEQSISRVIHYLFKGSQIQRNYSTLYLARRNIWKPVNQAYKEGLIDYKQAYSR